jgi:transmembrane sensor
MKAESGNNSEEPVRRAAADWFARLRSGPLSAADQAALDAWRNSDPAHGETLDRLLRQWEQSRFLARGALASGRDLGRARVWHRRPSARVAAVAALLMIVIGGGLQLRREVDPAPLGYSAGKSSDRAVVLADGSKLILGPGSEVRVAYSPTLRRVDLLAGRARFDVVQDARRPFTVFADGGSVRAIGTVFEVELASTLVRVRLLQGRVEVRANALRAPDKAQRLSAGEAIGFARGQLVPIASAAQSHTELPNGMLSFNDAPLASVIEQFNRHAHPGIELGSERIARLRVTGAYRVTDSHAFARAAAAMFGLELRHDPSGAISLHEPSPNKLVG